MTGVYGSVVRILLRWNPLSTPSKKIALDTSRKSIFSSRWSSKTIRLCIYSSDCLSIYLSTYLNHMSKLKYVNTLDQFVRDISTIPRTSGVPSVSPSTPFILVSSWMSVLLSDLTDGREQWTLEPLYRKNVISLPRFTWMDRILSSLRPFVFHLFNVRVNDEVRLLHLVV